MQIRQRLSRLWQHVEEDDIAGLAAELACRSFLELFPFFVFCAAVGDAAASMWHVQNPVQMALQLLSDSMPQETADPIRQQLEAVTNTRPPGVAVFSILGALWLAAGGGSSLMKAMNRIYRIQETRPWWERQLVGLGLSLLVGSVVILALGILAASQLVAQTAGGESAPGWFQAVSGFARWPMLLIVLTAEALVLYRLAPDSRLPMRWVNPGAAVFAAGWLFASVIFVLYVKAAGAYAQTYGVLGGIIVVLLWLQLTAYALLLGAEVNGLLEDPQTIKRFGGHPVDDIGAAQKSRPRKKAA